MLLFRFCTKLFLWQPLKPSALEQVENPTTKQGNSALCTCFSSEFSLQFDTKNLQSSLSFLQFFQLALDCLQKCNVRKATDTVSKLRDKRWSQCLEKHLGKVLEELWLLPAHWVYQKPKQFKYAIRCPAPFYVSQAPKGPQFLFWVLALP